MVDQEKAAVLDESEKIEKHEEIKNELRNEVHQEIRQTAREKSPAERAEIKQTADALKAKAVNEVAQTESQIEKAKKITTGQHIVDYVFYLIYGLIGMEIVLDLLGARQAAGFKQFIDTITTPILAPFRGLLVDPGVGPFRLMLSYIFALFFYLFLHFAIKRFLRLFTK